LEAFLLLSQIVCHSYTNISVYISPKGYHLLVEKGTS
jgi:hypothetical protein